MIEIKIGVIGEIFILKKTHFVPKGSQHPNMLLFTLKYSLNWIINYPVPNSTGLFILSTLFSYRFWLLYRVTKYPNMPVIEVVPGHRTFRCKTWIVSGQLGELRSAVKIML